MSPVQHIQCVPTGIHAMLHIETGFIVDGISRKMFYRTHLNTSFSVAAVQYLGKIVRVESGWTTAILLYFLK